LRRPRFGAIDGVLQADQHHIENRCGADAEKATQPIASHKGVVVVTVASPASRSPSRRGPRRKQSIAPGCGDAPTGREREDRPEKKEWHDRHAEAFAVMPKTT